SFQRGTGRFSFLSIVCAEGLSGRCPVEINSARHVRHPAGSALCGAGRFAVAASLENHAPGQTPRTRDALMGRMAALLDDAPLSSAYLHVFVFPFAMVVPVRRSKLAGPFASIDSAVPYSRHVQCLCHYRV